VVTISGTPTVYINGREYDLQKFDMEDDLDEWIKLEIELAGTAGPAPTPAASATPAAASSKKTPSGK
jgi:hypothetical protein